MGKFWTEGRKEEKEKVEGKRGGKGKERQGKRENGEEKKGNCKREEENLKWKGKGMKMRRGPFFFFFCLSLFETNEICMGCTKMEISTGKKLGNGKFSNLAHL